ncbi:hypothetical protein [Kitasatospora sp. NPDC001527]|uniref:hypothetical protein n=1 Tax=Kitasatospora sp. NPDC001527 TaxID=3154519 RepID=UPI00332A7823
MKCPHCSAELPTARHRVNRLCWRCRQSYALEPKRTRGLTDVRLRRTAERLGDEGRVTLTAEQLRWALHPRGRPSPVARRSTSWRPVPPRFTEPAEIAATVGVGLALLTAAYLLLTVLEGLVGLAVPVGFFGLLALGSTASDLARLSRRRKAVAAWEKAELAWQAQQERDRQEAARWTAPLDHRPTWSSAEFRTSVLAPWAEVYGGLPEGVVEDSAVTPVVPPGAAALAVLCPDPTVTAFLHANSFPERYGALLVATPGQLPEDLPVVVLHDASPQGCLLVAEVRAARPDGPVVDAGLSARAVLAAQDRAVQLYAHQLREPLEALLRGLPRLTGAERAWFEAGLWSPLAAVPPKRLLATAERAAERALNRHVGFLSWPVPEVPR